MAEIRRRKPDDEKQQLVDDEGGDGLNGSDDEQLHHHNKPSSGLTTADSSDHVNTSLFFTILKPFLVWFGGSQMEIFPMSSKYMKILQNANVH